MPLTFNVFTGTFDFTGGGGPTSVSNADGTLTISPTTGAVVASLALGHANTWTAKQTLQLVTEQLRIGYDVNNYWKTTISSVGNASFDLVGTSPTNSFLDPVAVGKTWDEGGLQLRYGTVPTLIIDSSSSTAQTNFELRQGNTQRWAFYVPASSVDFRFYNYEIGADNLTLTGTTGDMSLALGHLKISTVGKGLFVKEGSNAKMGTATLSGGTVVVSTTAVTANSRIFLTAQSLGTITVGQGLAVTARTAGTSFTITSQSAVDTSVVAWILIEPA